MERFKKTPERDTQNEAKKEDTFKNTFSRRNFLFGSAAAFGAAALSTHEAKANLLTDFFSKPSLEKENASFEKIKAYEALLMENQATFEDPNATKQELIDAFTPYDGIPSTDKAALEAAGHYPDALFRKNGSWPAVQIRLQSDQKDPVLRFAQDGSVENNGLKEVANCFFSDFIFLLNTHVQDDLYANIGAYFDTLGNSFDVKATAVDDMQIDASARKKIDGTNLAWDRRKTKEELHGKLLHIASIDRAGNPEDNTDILSGVAIKLTDAFLWTQEKGSSAFFEQTATEKFGAVLRNSYMCIVPSRDINGDGIANGNDDLGMSGSPVFTDKDCVDGVTMPSGIVWGTGTVYDDKRRLSYTAVFFHGPDALGEIIDKTNTIVSGFMDEAAFPQKRALTLKVQEALVARGFDIAVDGEYGGHTQEAVAQFQQRSFDEKTLASSILLGDIDRRTWDVLFPDEAHINRLVLYASMLK